MNSFIDIAHPRLLTPGTAQDERLMPALDTDHVKVDERNLSDLLSFIYAFAGRINHYDEKLSVSHWQSFFEKNILFVLARLHHLDIDLLRLNFSQLQALASPEQEIEGLSRLFHFMEKELILLLHQHHLILNKITIERAKELDRTILSNARSPILSFLGLANGSQYWYGTGKFDLSQFESDPAWRIDLSDLYSLDQSFRNVPGNRSRRIAHIRKSLEDLGSSLLELMEAISTQAATVLRDIQQAPEGKKNEAHIGLILAFLRLFEHVRGDINNLTKRHLEFFYTDVLCVQPKGAEPDQAFIIFELQKHIKEHFLAAGTQLLDGKDRAKQNILFDLESGIVIDEAQITEVKSLYLEHNEGYKVEDPDPDISEPKNCMKTDGEKVEFVQGLYVSTNARTKDGLEEALDDGQSWHTLGRRFSKSYPVHVPPVIEPKEYPSARIGFVLESSVLLLNEGRRRVKITIQYATKDLADHCIENPDLGDIKPTYFTRAEYFLTSESLEEAIGKGLHKNTAEELKNKLLNNQLFIPLNELPGDNTDKNIIKDTLKLKRPFSLALTTEEGWYIPKEWLDPDNSDVITFDSDNRTLIFSFKLQPDEPAITFPNAEILEEDLKAEMPLVKIQLEDKMKIHKETDVYNPHCTLERCCSTHRFDISLYHYFRHLTVADTKIEVEVCGVKDLIVQNDESVQDVNSVIHPFGARPKVTKTPSGSYLGSSFYIGSKEVFYKGWDSVRINVEWKDRPLDFGSHYEAYGDIGPFEDGSSSLTNDSFKLKPGILLEGQWHTGNTRKLFSTKNHFPPCNAPVTQYNHVHHRFSISEFPVSPEFGPIPIAQLDPLNTASRRGFIKLELQNVSFQHHRYAFVLAQQMFKLAQVADLIKLEDTINTIDDACTIAEKTKDKIKQLRDLMETAGVPNPITPAMLAKFVDNPFPPPVDIGLSPLSVELQVKICGLLTDIQQITGSGTPKLPNEPYTPQIKTLSIDYKATADIDDINLIHLYSFKNTHKTVNIKAEPTLLPTYVDEGILYLGLENVKPGNNLNILFQLAESTANAEAPKAKIYWYYLKDNDWHSLHEGFHIINDGTSGLTRSGIIKIKSPLDLTATGHTIMPFDKYWLKASAFRNTISVCETIQVHTQAALAEYKAQPLSDREAMKLDANSIGKLLQTDSSVKAVNQPYQSFGGRLAEKDQLLHQRIAELLRHKNRGIAYFDYERQVLEQYPQIWRAKSVAHTLATNALSHRRDLEMAPGFVLIAVIPDIKQLVVSDSTEPRCPVSLLDEIRDFLRARISPFIRLKIENPRYEGVHIQVQAKFRSGFETPFFQNKLESEIRNFLAPWRLGEISQMQFGRPVYKTHLIQFIESRDYIDFISCLEWRHSDDKNTCCEPEKLVCHSEAIYPRTARSILIGGDILVHNPLVRASGESIIFDRNCPEVVSIKCPPKDQEHPSPPIVTVI